MLTTLLAAVPPSAFAMSCDPALATMPYDVRAVEAAINRAYRAEPDLTLRKRMELRRQGVGLIKPFRVRERPTLLDDGNLPAIGNIGDVVVIRRSRAAGLAELRAALDLAEERGFYFVPALDVWIYSTVEYADAVSCRRNGFLGRLLTNGFGRIETYHTHPWAAFHQNMADYGEGMRRNLEHISDETFAHLMLGLPSVGDIAGMISRGERDPRFAAPLMDHFVVHPWGVTYYSMHIVLDDAGGPHEQSIYAPGPGWEAEHLELARRQNSPASSINVLMREAIRLSDEHAWTTDRGEKPKLILRLEPWPDL